ncbi:ABC transporter substrate-binding protein [Quadrisphaera sp. DSM 44207]|uniref:ABC transporter substrate-binding protein n=1 Tax=Quadrisphaera sp. DSM 44207 TaxID=1881057 RepID=UPI00088B4188|nr:ABC transporter substrate-binding protein [Quadrisphaera sp. DSM 44207]SDQ70925.1 peptide/nickel transport system substrate-binding protein [Quadrisphaera sp. DSM 44207]
MDPVRAPRPRTALAAALAAGVLLLCACGAQPAGGQEAQDARVTVAAGSEPTSYDANRAGEHVERNLLVLGQVLRGFWRYGARGEVAPDPAFGTVTKTSDDPLVVEYAFAEGAVWSDGEPLDCDDAVLAWAAGSGLLGGAVDPVAGAGYAGTGAPACEDGDTAFTVAHPEPSALWDTAFGPGSILPAHVLEREAGVADVLAAVRGGPGHGLQDAARWWRTGWALDPGALDLRRLPASGPYRLADWQDGQSLTLTANPRWAGAPPRTPVLVLRFVEAAQQATALADGQVQVAAPPASADVVRQLERLGDGAAVQRGPLAASEHLLLDVAGTFADPQLRRALALCVPRSRIIDAVVAPVDPGASVLRARTLLPHQAGHADVAAASGGGSQAEDVAAARAVLEARGALGTVVRVGHDGTDPRRAEAVALVRASCGEAGFDVQDAGGDVGGDAGGDVGGDAGAARLGDGADAVLVTAPSPPDPVLAAQRWASGGGAAAGGYSSPVVDDLAAQLRRALDPSEQLDLLVRIEQELERDLPGLPLWTEPGVVAAAPGVEGVALQPGPAGVTWNAETWSVAAR